MSHPVLSGSEAVVLRGTIVPLLIANSPRRPGSNLRRRVIRSLSLHRLSSSDRCPGGTYCTLQLPFRDNLCDPLQSGYQLLAQKPLR